MASSTLHLTSTRPTKFSEPIQFFLAKILLSTSAFSKPILSCVAPRHLKSSTTSQFLPISDRHYTGTACLSPLQEAACSPPWLYSTRRLPHTWTKQSVTVCYSWLTRLHHPRTATILLSILIHSCLLVPQKHPNSATKALKESPADTTQSWHIPTYFSPSHLPPPPAYLFKLKLYFHFFILFFYKQCKLLHKVPPLGYLMYHAVKYLTIFKILLLYYTILFNLLPKVLCFPFIQTNDYICIFFFFIKASFHTFYTGTESV